MGLTTASLQCCLWWVETDLRLMWTIISWWAVDVDKRRWTQWCVCSTLSLLLFTEIQQPRRRLLSSLNIIIIIMTCVFSSGRSSFSFSFTLFVVECWLFSGWECPSHQTAQLTYQLIITLFVYTAFLLCLGVQLTWHHVTHTHIQRRHTRYFTTVRYNATKLKRIGTAQSLSALISSPVSSSKSLSLSVAVLERFYCLYVTLRCDLEIWPRNLDLWPWTCTTCCAMLWDTLYKV